MPKYIFIYNEPRIVDTDPDPDDSYHEVLYEIVEVAFEAENDENALMMADNIAKEKAVKWRDNKFVGQWVDKIYNAQPISLARVISEW